MNRLLLFFSLSLLVALASCKVKNTTAPVVEDMVDTHIEIELAYGCAYGDAHKEHVGEQLFAFAIGDVKVDSKGEVTDDSNGYYLQLVLYADELSKDQLLKSGIYTISPEVQAWNALSGYDVDPEHPGYAYGGCLLYNVEDGFRTEAVKLVSGTVTLDGSENDARFVIDAIGSDGNVYKYKSSGAVNMLDSLPKQDEFYRDYERDSVQEITINANRAELTVYLSYNMFTLWFPDYNGGYSASIAAFIPTSKRIIGTFPVGSSYYDTTPGTVLYSGGFRDGSLCNSFAGVTYDRGKTFDSDNYSIFFITGGYMTIDENDNVTATFTTFYGSTVNINFTGSFTRK